MFRYVVREVAVVAALVLTAGIAGAASNDSLTGIPVYPAAAGDNDRIPGGICRVKAQTVVYALPSGFRLNGPSVPPPTVARVDGWYSAHASRYQFIHGFDGSRTQDVFLGAYGRNAVTITGDPKPSSAAFSISFTHFSAPVRAEQVTGFASGQKAGQIGAGGSTRTQGFDAICA
jgi:hypothetical protein